MSMHCIRLTFLLACCLFASGMNAANEPPRIWDENDLLWAVRLSSEADPRALARQWGVDFVGPVGSLPNTYLLGVRRERAARLNLSQPESWLSERVSGDPQVEWSEFQEADLRAVRHPARDETFFDRQWYLENRGQQGGLPGVDARALAAWEQGYTGQGVHVAVVDTGTQYNHPDLIANFAGGLDTWGMGSGLPLEDNENHGTAVTGIISASLNGVGTVGVAHNARFHPIRLLRGERESVGDFREAEALGYRLQEVAVSNNSWGPSSDEGVRLAPMRNLARQTVRQGVEEGRQGKGIVYVWAAGNGAEDGERSSYDGYASSRYTIAVGAIGQDGRATGFTEPGSNVLISAPSYSAGHGITTTDRTGSDGYSSRDYVRHFSGTSAATPIVSGVVALMLEANPDLTWRDVQHVLARTAVRTDHDNPEWFSNGAGFYLQDQYGFGRVDALGAVRLAKMWPGVGNDGSSRWASGNIQRAIPAGGSLTHSIEVSTSRRAESVDIFIDMTHNGWRHLEIAVTSPSGTRSILAAPFEEQAHNFREWTFNSVQFWGEQQAGEWTLEIIDRTGSSTAGQLRSWAVEIHGAPAGTSPAIPQLSSPLFTSSLEEVPLGSHFLADPGDWILISAVALDRGVVEAHDDEWFFVSPLNGYGRFPVGMTFASPSSGEARHLVMEIERPALWKGNEESSVSFSSGTDVFVHAEPNFGTLVQEDDSFTYITPFVSEPDGAPLRDRFALRSEELNTIVWYPVLAGDRFARSLNGRSEHIAFRLPGSNPNNRFTIETHFRPDAWGSATTGFGRILDSRGVAVFLNGYGHAFYPDASFVVFLTYLDGSTAPFHTAANTAQLGHWQHLAVSFQAGSLNPVRLYLDGNELPLSTVPDLAPTSTGNLASLSNVVFRLGDSPDGDRSLRGAFRSFALWDEVLPASRIAAHALHFDPEEANDALVAWDWRNPASGAANLHGQVNLIFDRKDGAWEALEVPWADLQAYLPRARDVRGDGWVRHPELGWWYADFFPWLWAAGVGWHFAAGEGAGSYWFYRAGNGLGWFYTNDQFYPWIYAADHQTWAWHYSGTSWYFFASTQSDIEFPD